MSTEKLGTNMDAIRIIPKEGCNQHRPDGSMHGVIPPSWKYIPAHRYLVHTGSSDSRFANVLEVVRHQIKDSVRLAVIIVHMRMGTGNPTVNPQADIIRAAISKEIPIFVTQRPMQHKPDASMGNFKPNTADETRNTLPDVLKTATGNYQKLYYFEGGQGNALDGTDSGNTRLRDVINGYQTAIVFGMELGQCVDSTILGTARKNTEETYFGGLLDLKISVVTARGVLLPAVGEPNSEPHDYFNFQLLHNIVFPIPPSGSGAKSTGGQSQSPLAAATSFPKKASIEAATKI